MSSINNSWEENFVFVIAIPCWNFLMKESLLIKLDRSILNKNFSSAKLFLFDNS